MTFLHILLASVAFISDPVAAEGLPDHYPRENIFAQMDGKIYKAEGMQVYPQWIYPSWMQQAQMSESIAVDAVYLRPHSGYAYSANLRIDHKRAIASGSHSAGREPVSVRVIIENNYHKTYYRAENFQIQQIPSHQRQEPSNINFPRKNYIYIARIGGPVYSAAMIDYTPYIGPHHGGPIRPDRIVADGLNVLIPNNNILVRMDGTIYKTEQINMRSWFYCPVWLQQGQFSHMINHDSIYIRLSEDYTYEATLSPHSRFEPHPAYTHDPIPTSVRIHIVLEGEHTFYKSGLFELAHVPHKNEAENADDEYPFKDYIYIARRGGPVYCARLIEFLAPQGPIPSNKALHLAIHV